MGKISQSYLKELAEKKKFGQKGYKELPNDQNVRIPVTGALKGTKEFYTSFMNSPRYQQMLEGKTFNPYGTFRGVSSDYIRDARLRNLQGSKDDIYTFGNPKDWKTYTGNSDDVLGFSKSTSGAIYLNPLFYNKPQPETFEDSELRRETLSHEFSHSIDRPLPYTGIRLIPEEDIYEIKDRTLANQREFLKKKGNKRSTWEYLTEPTEIRARINSVRERLWKNGIDIGKRQITAEDIKDINTENLKDLRDVLKEEDIIWMLNNISKTESPQKEKYAQSGAYISTQGYKRNSPDVNNPYNVIPTNRITMKDVDFPIMGIDDMGYQQMMYPGNDYTYPGNYVTEFPLKNMGNKRYGQQGFYKPDFRSKSQIAASQGNTGESTKVGSKINPVDMRKAQEAAMQRAIANQPTFRQGRTLSANEQAENQARLAKIREQQEEEENRRRLTFTGNAEARGAGTLMQPLLDVINPFSYYYAGKDAVRGLGQAAEGISNLDLKGRGLEQIGSGLMQTGLSAAQLYPGISAGKPALKAVSKYATTKTPLKNAYKLNPNLTNPFGFKNVGDQPHWWKGYTQQVTPQNIDLNAGFGEWKKTILKKLSEGNYSKEQAQALLSKTPFSKFLGRGVEGTVYEFPNYPEYAIKIGQPGSSGVVNQEIIQELAPFTKQGNIAVPLRSSGQIKVPGAVPYQATVMQNLNKVGQPLNLSARDAQALYLKQVRALRDAGYSLDMVNPANVSFNPRKGVYDIFDLAKTPSVAKDPKYLQKAYDFLKEKGTYQGGGTMLAEPDYDIYKAPKQGNYLLPDINRPYYTDEQGGNRSEYKMGFNIDGKETLLPSVVGGRQLTPEETRNRYYQTGLHMGQYNTPEEAEYAARLRTAKYNMLQDPARFNASMFQMGGTMSVPGVNGQVVSSGPQPLTSVKKTRGPITKNKKGDIKTMSNQQVKQVLKYSKQKPNKI